MLAKRVVGTETQNLTEDQGLEEQTDAENPKKIRGKRYMTAYNLFMKENSVSFTLISLWHFDTRVVWQPLFEFLSVSEFLCGYI